MEKIHIHTFSPLSNELQNQLVDICQLLIARLSHLVLADQQAPTASILKNARDLLDKINKLQRGL